MEWEVYLIGCVFNMGRQDILARFGLPTSRIWQESLITASGAPNAGDDVGLELKNVIVWNKDNGGMGSFYRSKHELVCAWKYGTAPHTNTFELGQQSATAPTSGTTPGSTP